MAEATHAKLGFKRRIIVTKKIDCARKPFAPATLLSVLLTGLSLTAVSAQSEADTASRQTIPVGNIVDLTHTLTEDFPYNPVSGVYYPFEIDAQTTVNADGVASNEWKIHEHIGTQIDAPSHFSAAGKSLEQLSVENFIAPLAVIDISGRARRDPDTMVTVDDIRTWEQRYGRLPQGAAVFMRSGWDRKVADPQAFVNLDASNTMHAPGFAPAAAEFLIRERSVAGIGVDTLSIDAGNSKTFPVHKSWLRADKWGVECVANLDQVPPAGATVFVGASKVEGATGGPVRLIATF